jgi:Uma2 family endonuclease
MRTDVTRKLFTVGDYHRMAEAGILQPATDLFISLFRGKAIVTVQNPVQLNPYNEPQPDLVLAKPRADYYASNHPTAEDVLLLLEVADTTLQYDKDVKLPLYAGFGILEVWIVDLEHNLILVFRDPAGNAYQTNLTLHPGHSLSTIAFPEIVLKVDNLLG